MRNNDGGIWRLRWEIKDGRYTGSVIGHPRVKATANTFAEMERLLTDAVSDKLQAGEWTADWDPAPPDPEGSLGRTLQSHVTLAWEGRFVALQEPGEIFAAYCLTCGMASGPRTENKLRVAIESPGNLCGDFGSLPGGLDIYSRELADAIATVGGGDTGVAFRSVERLGRGRKEYVEPVCDAGVALPSTVSIRADKQEGWRCETCGFAYRYADLRTNGVQSFYRLTDLPTDRPIFWIADLAGAPSVCVPAEWWRKNRRAKFSTGVVSCPIGVAGDDAIDSTPGLRSFAALERRPPRKRWLFTQQRFASAQRIPFTPWAL